MLGDIYFQNLLLQRDAILDNYVYTQNAARPQFSNIIRMVDEELDNL